VNELSQPSSRASIRPILETRNLTRRSCLDQKLLLDCETLVVSPGDQIVCRGKSGSGKTVLLRALAALDHTEGELLWRGALISRRMHPAFRSNITYLHHTPRLPEGTVRGALQEPFSWSSHAVKQFDESKVSSWLQNLGRGADFLGQTNDNLSGGESQIVSVVRALQLSPSALLLDEPTSAIDGETVANFESLVCDWVKQGERAFVWVTHDGAQAARIGNRTIAVQNGIVSDA
jgi:putative ABC transport system ATP-binding protein